MFFSKMTLDREAIISGRFRELVTGPYQVHEMIWGLFADHPDHRSNYRSFDQYGPRRLR